MSDSQRMQDQTVSRESTAYRPPNDHPFVGFWRRVIASIIDTVIVMGILGILYAVTFAQSFGRGCAHLVSGLIPFSIAFIMIAFLSQKRGLHDLMAGTYVVNR